MKSVWFERFPLTTGFYLSCEAILTCRTGAVVNRDLSQVDRLHQQRRIECRRMSLMDLQTVYAVTVPLVRRDVVRLHRQKRSRQRMRASTIGLSLTVVILWYNRQYNCIHTRPVISITELKAHPSVIRWKHKVPRPIHRSHIHGHSLLALLQRRAYLHDLGRVPADAVQTAVLSL